LLFCLYQIQVLLCRGSTKLPFLFDQSMGTTKRRQRQPLPLFWIMPRRRNPRRSQAVLRNTRYESQWMSC
jgi:hypothetical protein